jgi:hypothetical protein
MVNYGMCCRIAVEEFEVGTQEGGRAKEVERKMCERGRRRSVPGDL